MNISAGHWIFALIFFIAFMAALLWSYSKDKKMHINYYKGAYKILLFIGLLLFILYAFVKLKNKL